jgi:hypothetical protein
MRKVYSTESAETSFNINTLELESKLVSLTRVKQLTKWVKKYSKIGAYMECEEVKPNQYKVDIFAPKIHIDVYGNMAIVESPA